MALIMATETCWCCDSVMKSEEIPFTKCRIHWCDVCDPLFDKVAFCSEFDFNTINQ